MDNPEDRADQEDRLMDLHFGLAFPPTSPEAAKADAVTELTELDTLRGNALTEDEWADCRRSILDGLVSNKHIEPTLIGSLMVLGLVGVGAIAYCARTGAWQWVWGIGATLVFMVFLGWRLRRALSAKRQLTPADRLAVVEELVARELMSPEEAAGLRDRIAALEA